MKLAEQYLKMHEKEIVVEKNINEDLPPKLQTALDRLSKKPTQAKADLGVSLLNDLIQTMATSPAGIKMLKEFAVKAYDAVVRGEGNLDFIDDEDTIGGSKGKDIKKAVADFIGGGNTGDMEYDRAEVELGAILEVKGDKYGDATIVVLAKKAGGFYYVQLKNGKILPDARVAHSNNYPASVKFVSTGEKFRGDVVEYKGHSWFNTGFTKVDHQVCTLGPAYQAFSASATPAMKSVFSDLEDRNLHRDNGEFVYDILHAWMSKTKQDTTPIVAKYRKIADEA